MMTEQMYTTDTAAERLARSVAEAVEVGGRFSRAEFSVDDVATILEAAVQQPNRDAVQRVAKVIERETDEPGWSAVVIARAVLAALATSQPVQVTDDMVKRADAAYWDHARPDTLAGMRAALEAAYLTPAQPVQVEVTETVIRDALDAYLSTEGSPRDAMRAALSAALGGGDQ